MADYYIPNRFAYDAVFDRDALFGWFFKGTNHNAVMFAERQVGNKKLRGHQCFISKKKLLFPIFTVGAAVQQLGFFNISAEKLVARKRGNIEAEF